MQQRVRFSNLFVFYSRLIVLDLVAGAAVSAAIPRLPFPIVPPEFPRLSPGPPPCGKCLEYLPREASRGHLEQIPEPPQPTPLDVEKQRTYSELLSSSSPG
ncbi:hypothetical protein CHARACLAT_007697 [Characodon lateralis]|uniref:Secreted protein n=1 Tax=Characodon lateralis TaxID=208331 RepID=A0ABU7DZH8_9TELE|nr:hypothetical protein [Characodon lateralis]